MAAAIGTSHRMVIYHFGSRTGLLAEVVAVVEREQREALANLGRSGRPPDEVMWAMWERLASSALAPHERQFFELYARGLQGDPAAARLMGEAVDAWLGPLAEVYERFGFAPEYAAAEGRLALAVARGLLLDLLASGRRDGVDAPCASTWTACSRGSDRVARMELVLRPLAAADTAELRRIRATPEVARWWDPPEDDFPTTDDPESTRATIVVDGAVAGLIQFSEELEPKYRHASIDLFLDPALHGRGLGTEAVRRLARHLIVERGHHRITIDPATENAAAIRSYGKAGFKPVGVMRRYERDPDGRGWHDGLLMELLAGEE